MKNNLIPRYLILGAGVSGRAAEALVRSEGAECFVSAKTEGGMVTENFVAKSGRYENILVVSPGIPPGDPEIVRAKESGMRVVGEMQFGVSRFKGRVIAITGSKGKSSLVKFIADALNGADGGKAFALPCGNYGLAMCEVAAAKPQPEVAVLECSSFQLEYGPMEPGPDAALILNIQPDHLDRHGSMENYRAAKMNIFGNMREGALRLMPEDLENCGNTESRNCGNAESRDCGILWRGSYFDNRILRPAAVGAVRILRHFGLEDARIAEAFRAFAPLPHRMRRVAEHGGVAFVDDSKATSLAAMEAGVEMCPKPVFLIAGGRLKEKMKNNGKILLENGAGKVYIIGECAREMAEAWRGELPAAVCDVMDKAVSAAYADALGAGGGTVLLSPGTASFDQFKNYEERGDAFAAAAMKAINFTISRGDAKNQTTENTQ